MNDLNQNGFPTPDLSGSGGDSPVLQTVRRLGQSVWFLAALLVYGANLAFGIASSLQPPPPGSEEILNISLILNIPQIILAAGLLVFYLSCRAQSQGGVNPVGMQILYYTEIVLAVLFALGCAIVIGAYIITLADGGPDAFLNDGIWAEALSGIDLEIVDFKTLILIIGVVLAIVAAAFTLLFIFGIKALKRIVKTVKTGAFAGKIPMGLPVMLILLASLMLIGLLASENGFLDIGSGVTNVASYLLFSICIFKYNGEMEPLWFAV